MFPKQALSPASLTLLVPVSAQSFYWIHSRRTPRRQIAGHRRDTEKHHGSNRKRHRIQRALLIRQARHQPRQNQRCRQSRQYPHHRQHETLTPHDPQNIRALRPDRQANPQLVSALRHPVRQQAVNPRISNPLLGESATASTPSKKTSSSLGHSAPFANIESAHPEIHAAIQALTFRTDSKLFTHLALYEQRLTKNCHANMNLLLRFRAKRQPVQAMAQAGSAGAA